MNTKIIIVYWKGKKFWLGKILEHSEIMSQGETVEEAERAAAHLIRQTYHENGSLCVLVTLRDLINLSEQEQPSFRRMLINKINEFRFGNPKNPKGA